MVSEGENITGTLKCAPNTRNNRDLDINIAYKVSESEEHTVIDYKMCATNALHVLWVLMVSRA